MGLTEIDLNLIKAFVFVAEEKGFSKAAKRLFIEQSAVSKAIKRLEDSLDAVLFLRTKRRVELTTKGASLLPIAKQVLLSSEDFVKLALDKENELSGTMRFGAVSPISFVFLPEVILRISRDYPRLWPMMYTGLVDDLSRRVLRRELEFAFLEYEANRIKELEYRQLGFCRYEVVASPRIDQHGLNSFIGSREVHDATNVKLPTFEKLRKMNKNIQIKYSTNDFAANRELILKGVGVGLLPRTLIENDLARKRLKILHPELKLIFPVFAVFHGSYRLSLEAERAMEIFRSLLLPSAS